MALKSIGTSQRGVKPAKLSKESDEEFVNACSQFVREPHVHERDWITVDFARSPSCECNLFTTTTIAAENESLIQLRLIGDEGAMALVVFLRGVNVGGHRTFRPSVVANELSEFDVVNVGAAGTFVVRNRISQTKLRAELHRYLAFEAEVVICKGNDVLDLASANPFAGQPAGPKIVRFVSILAKRGQPLPSTPLRIPSGRTWSVKILGTKDRFVLGVYRREMKTIRYLGQLDKIFGVLATTRNWNTITAIARILQNAES